MIVDLITSTALSRDDNRHCGSCYKFCNCALIVIALWLEPEVSKAVILHGSSATAYPKALSKELHRLPPLARRNVSPVEGQLNITFFPWKSTLLYSNYINYLVNNLNNFWSWQQNTEHKNDTGRVLCFYFIEKLNKVVIALCSRPTRNS